MDISLSKGVRSNLLHLQMTADLMGITQERLATGKKVNTALDNPTNFFTAASLNSRSNDISLLMDGMSNGIKTIEAADNGIKAITKTVESMQSTLRQARQDKSFKSEYFTNDPSRTAAAADKLSFKGGSVGTTPVDVSTVKTKVTATGGFTGDNTTIPAALNGKNFKINAAGGTQQVIAVATGDTKQDIVDKLNLALSSASATTDAKATINKEGNIEINSQKGDTIDVAAGDGGLAAIGLSAASSTKNANKTTDELVAAINDNASLKDRVEAKVSDGKLRIKNLSTKELDVTGADSTGVTGKTTNKKSITGNEIRRNLINQFNELYAQLDKLAEDAAFNGINLLDGDKLKLTFNETGTSQMEIQAKDASGAPTSINNAKLGIDPAINGDFDLDSSIDGRLDKLGDALGKLRSHAATFGTNLSIVQNRTDFSKHMMNTLKTGADNLTLADGNEEAANMLALKTRQQLSTSALSMASQADQAILRLFS